MDDIKIFYDNHGKAEFVQLVYAEYEKLVNQAKESVDLKNALKKINDLAGAFTS